ncbi:hypothetical protein ACKVWH_003428 [Pyricularia oryzae]
MATEDIKYGHPKLDVTEAFMCYGDAIHSRLAWSGGCSSWYKGGTKDGRVTVLFAGGVHLFHHLLSEIRGEDFNIVYRTANPFDFWAMDFSDGSFKQISTKPGMSRRQSSLCIPRRALLRTTVARNKKARPLASSLARVNS